MVLGVKRWYFNILPSRDYQKDKVFDYDGLNPVQKEKKGF